MSFKKRSIGASKIADRSVDLSTSADTPDAATTASTHSAPVGTRPSPIDGRLTTSTGTPTLDALLAGHAGLPLGHSILLEENGTTDYAGSLLKYYAAEGIVQGHELHIVGVRDGWTRELPGLVGVTDNKTGAASISRDEDKMKIAWRYEKLGQFGEGPGSRGVFILQISIDNSQCNTFAAAASERHGSSNASATSADQAPFCHVFDLAKRLVVPSAAVIHYISLSASSREAPFSTVLQHLTTQLRASSSDTIHRVVIPTLLSPALYPPHASDPAHLIQFFHSLRSLLRQYPSQLTVMTSIPLELYPRATSLVRWLELLNDGFVELTPFPHAFDEGPGSLSTSGAATSHEEQPQGMVKVHKLPVFHERGGGSGGLKSMGDDLAFTVSRRKFTIRPFSLPPAEGDTEAQKGNAEGAQSTQKLTKEQIDF